MSEYNPKTDCVTDNPDPNSFPRGETCPDGSMHDFQKTGVERHGKHCCECQTVCTKCNEERWCVPSCDK